MNKTVFNRSPAPLEFPQWVRCPVTGDMEAVTVHLEPASFNLCALLCNRSDTTCGSDCLCRGDLLARFHTV